MAHAMSDEINELLATGADKSLKSTLIVYGALIRIQWWCQVAQDYNMNCREAMSIPFLKEKL